MRNFLDPFYLFAKQTELNDMKKTCFTRGETEHDTDIQWVSYFNDLNHYNEIIQAQVDGDHAADLYNINSHYLGILARAGAIRPITDYVEQYFPEYYWESNLQVGTWNGEIYGFWNERQNVNMAIYVNLDLIEEYSQANPAQLWQDGEWDWDAFTQMAAEVKANAPENFKIFGINAFQAGLYFIGSNGGKTIDPDTNAFQFSDPNTVTALEFIQDLTEQDYIWFAEDGMDTTTRAEFTSGNMLFYFGSDWISGDSSILKPGSAVNFELGMVPFPVGPDVTSVEEDYRLPITVGNLWVVRGDATDAEAESYVQFFSNIIPWGDDEEQDFRYYKTMEDHTDDLTSLEAYISISRYGYFEKSYLFELVWGDDLVPGIGNIYIDIAEGASISATIDAALAALEAKRDEALGIVE
jgi:ABC-type glycerol-3-phosphate transport system substrate-binding protein